MTISNAHLSRLRIVSAIVLLLSFILVPFFLLGTALEPYSSLPAEDGRMAAAGSAALLLCLDAVLPVPASAVATASGYALGAWAGTAVNALGLTAGCVLGMLLGRSGSPLARRILGEGQFAAFQDWVDRYGIASVLLCRAVPVLAEASLIALGAGKARPLPILAAALLADTVLGALYAFAGAAMDKPGGSAVPAAAAVIGVPVIAGLIAFAWLRLSTKASRPSATD
jgi:uncharacterized membrane protein YdjX (TVP38/TMEM64 family)